MNVSELVKKTLEELHELMSTKTIVGDPIPAGDYTLIPVSKVMFGFGSGGGENSMNKSSSGAGEAIGGGWTVEPIAFIVIGPEGPKMFTIGEKDSVASKLIDLAPKVVDTVKAMVDSKAKDETEPTKEK